ALAVQDRGTGRSVPSGGFAHLGAQGVMDALPSSIQTPDAVVAGHGAPRRQVVGKGPPLAARPQVIEDAVEHFPDIHGARVAARLGVGNERLQARPLFVGEVAGVRVSHHTPLLPSSVPFHTGSYQTRPGLTVIRHLPQMTRKPVWRSSPRSCA